MDPVDPVDRRPRESNCSAGLLADYAIATQKDVDILQRDDMYDTLRLKVRCRYFLVESSQAKVEQRVLL